MYAQNLFKAAAILTSLHPGKLIFVEGWFSFFLRMEKKISLPNNKICT